MKISSAYPSRYVSAPDIPRGITVTVKISKVEMENVAGTSDPDDDKPVCYFLGKSKGLALNKTNARALAEAFGDETDDWTGKTIGLYLVETEYKGRQTQGVRISIANLPKPQDADQPAPETTPRTDTPPARGSTPGLDGPHQPVGDEDIPF